MTDNTSAVQGQWKEKILTVNSESGHMSIIYMYMYIYIYFFFFGKMCPEEMMFFAYLHVVKGLTVWIEPREEQEWKVKGFGEFFRWRQV